MAHVPRRFTCSPIGALIERVVRCRLDCFTPGRFELPSARHHLHPARHTRPNDAHVATADGAHQREHLVDARDQHGP